MSANGYRILATTNDEGAMGYVAVWRGLHSEWVDDVELAHALGEALEAAGGETITKMDEDLLDLVRRMAK